MKRRLGNLRLSLARAIAVLVPALAAVFPITAHGQAAACAANETLQTFAFTGTYPPASPTIVGTGATQTNLTFTSSNTGGVAYTGGTPHFEQSGNFNPTLTHRHTTSSLSILLSTFNLAFNRPVNKLRFTATDVDRSTGNWQDAIVVRVNGSTDPTSMTGGPDHTFPAPAPIPTTGSGYASGNFNCIATDPACNIVSSFNTTNITSAAMQFWAGPAAGGNEQHAGWNQFEWCLPLPTLDKAFSAGLPVGGTTTLTFTVSQPVGNPTQTFSFTDTLPSGLRVGAGAVGGTCSGGSVTATAGTSTITVAGRQIVNPATSCTITVPVTTAASPTVGVCPQANNTNGNGNISGTTNVVAQIANSAAGGGSSTTGACVTVYNRATLAKSYSPVTVGVGASSTLTFTINNGATNPAQSGLAFTDTFPAGLTVTGVSAIAGAGCGGTPGFTASTVSLSGATMTGGTAACTFTATVRGDTAGSYVNASGQFSLQGGGLDTSATTATLNVRSVALTKSYAAASIATGQSSTLTFTLTNGTGNPAQSNLTFTDTLATGAGLTVTGVTALSGAGCSATVPTFNATSNPSVTLTGATMALTTATCTFTVTVQGNTAGSYANTSANITGATAPINATAMSSTLTVYNRATLAKSYSPVTVGVGASSTLTFTINNGATNPAQSGLAFTDTFPAGLTVTGVSAIAGAGCGGTPGFTASTVSLSGATMTGGTAACTFTATVRGDTAGSYVNASGQFSLQGGGLDTSATTATLNVRSVALTKSYAAASIATGQSSTLTFTLTNGTGNPAQSNLTFTDTLATGAGLTVTGVTALSGAGCSATVPTFNATSNPSVTLTGATMALTTATCTFTVTVQGNTAGSYANTSANITGATAPINATAMSSTLTVYNRATLAKSYSPVTVGVGASSTLTFTINNGATNPAQSGLAFTDTFPAGLTVTGVSAIAGAGCGGTPGFTASTVSLSGATMTGGTAACTFTATVRGDTAGSYVNASGQFSLQGGGLDTSATTATLNVRSVALTKSYAAASIATGQSSTLTFTLTNGTGNPAQSNLTFTDTLATGAGLTVTGVTALSGAGCSATVPTFNATSNPSVTLTGATMALTTATCTFTVTVQGNTAGSYANTSANITGATAPINATAMSSTLTVYNRATLAKSYSPVTVGVGASSTLTFTINNGATNPAQSGLAFTDTFPAGLTVTGVSAIAGAGCGGTPGFTASTVSLSGATMTGGTAACTFTATVRGDTAGSYVNASGQFSLQGGGLDTSATTATLTVFAAPTFAKAFAAPKNVAVGGATTLTFTLTNGNAQALTGATFIDDFPAGVGLANATVGGSCAAGAVQSRATTGATPFGAITAGHISIQVAGYTIPASGSCTIVVNVVSSTAGAKANTSGALTTAEGTTTAAASDTLNVYTVPTVVKSFAPPTIAAGGTSTLTITVTNPAANPGNLTGVSIGDAYTGTLVNNAAGSVVCSGAGSATLTGGVNLGTSVGFASGTIVPGGTCTITQSVTATTTNTNATTAPAATGPVALTGTAATGVVLTVVGAPVVTKSFVATNVAVGGTTTMNITVENPAANTVALTGVAFTDTYPAGLTGALTASASPAGCTGTLTALAGSLALTGGVVPVATTCTYAVTVTGATAGAKLNSTGAVTSTNGASGAAASATLNVYTVPTVVKSFAPPTIAAGGTSTLTITVTNPAANPGNLTGVSIGDAYTGTLVNNAAGSVVCSGAGSATLTGGVNLGTSVGFASGTIVPGGTCTITQSVTATTTNTNATTAPAATGPVALTGTAATGVVLTVVGAPVVTKSFVATNVAVGGTTTMNITVENPAANTVALTGVAFTDTYPAGLTGALTASASPAGCTGTLTALAGSLALTGGVVPVATTCTYAVTVTGATAGAKLNSTGAVTSTNGASGAAASATLNVYTVPTVVKSFAPPTIAAGGTSTLTITVTNPAANPGNLTGVSIGDAYTGTLVNNAAGSVVCSGAGSATLTGGVNLGTSVGFASGTIVPGGTCTITQSVTATTTNTNATTAPAATGPVALTGTAATGVVLTVVGAPVVTKSFVATNVAVGGTTTMNITVENPAANTVALTGVAFTDTYPAGLTGALTASASPAGCTGTLTALAGSLALTGGVVPVATTCTYAVTVTGATAGAKLNSTGAVTSTNGASGAAASATLNVYTVPTVVKSFAPPTIAAGGTSTLTITVTNPAANPGNLTGVSIGDAYTGTLVNNAAGSVVCSGAGSATLTGGVNLGTSVGFASGTIVPGGTCTITQSVTATTTNTNATTAPAATGPVALTGTAATGVVLTVVGAPVVTKSFVATNVAVGGTTTMNITVENPAANTVALTGVAFTDTYPAGLTGALTASASPAGCTGTLTALAGSLALTGGVVPVATTCTYAVTVTGATAGAKLNSTGAVTSTNGASGAAASATLNVYTVPTVVKSFAPPTIAAGGTSTLTITVTNPAANPGNLTGVSIGDAYTGTLVNNAAGSVVCSGAGSATLTGGVNLGTSVGFASGTIVPGGTCTITQSVTATTTNTNATTAPAATGPVALTGTAATGVVLTVVGAPVVTKSFVATNVAVGGTTTMNITVENPAANTVALTGVAFTDTYPAGLTGALTASASPAGCTGTLTALAGSLALTGGVVPVATTCTYAVTVTGATAGAKLNSTGAVTSTNGASGAAASATLNVYTVPTVVKSFAPPTIAAGGTSTLTITVTNPAANPGNLTGVSIGDAYTGTLVNNAAGSVVCSGAGSATLTGGVNLGTSVGFASGTIVPGGTCTITQSVTATTTNTNATTAPAATGPVALTGTAATGVVLTVVGAPVVTKSFVATNVAVGGTTTMNITVENPAANTVALTGVAFTDTYPAGLTGALTASASPAGCTGTLTALAGSLALTGGVVPVATTCTYAVTVTGATAGAKLNSTGAVTSTNGASGAAASATLNVYTVPTVVKSFAPPTIAAGGTSTLTITVTNPAANPGNLTGVSIGDAYTGTLVNNAAGSVVCSGAGSATLTGGVNLGTSVGFASGTIVPGGTCTITQSVTATTTNTNATTAPAATGPVALTGTAATGVVLTVVGAPVVTKSFVATNVAVGGTTTMNITVENPAANTVALTGVAFTDTYPAGLTGALTASASPAGCTGTLTALAGSLALTGGVVPVATTCTYAVTVTGATAGAKLNSTGAVTSTNGASGAAASATLNVYTVPTVVKSFAPPTIAAGGTSTLTITVTNPAANPGNLTGVSIGDAYTGTLVNNAAGSVVCSGAGSATLTGGVNLGTSVGFASGTIVPGGTCTITQSVTATTTNTNATTAPAATGPVALTGTAATGVVLAVGVNTFAPDNAQTGLPGTVVFYSHTFNAGLAGSVAFSTSSVASPAVPGWAQTIYRDANCNGILDGAEGAAPIAGAIAVAAGDAVCIIVRDSIPGAAPYNAQDVITVTATFNGTQNLARTDVTTVGAAGGAGLTLAKTVRNVTQGGVAGTTGTARPDDVLEYTITYTNTGAGTVSSIVVADATPAFTLFQSAACGALPASLTACVVSTAPAVNGTGSLTWTLTGSLLAGGSGSVSYQVRVSN